MLYMFQAVPPHIIRSSILYIQHPVLCQTFTATCHCCGRDSISSTTVARSSKGSTKYPMLYIQYWAPDDVRRNRLKHVEHFTEINKLCKAASCWLNLKIRLRCTDPRTSNRELCYYLYCFQLKQNLMHCLSHAKSRCLIFGRVSALVGANFRGGHLNC